MSANVIAAIECFIVAGIAVWVCRPRVRDEWTDLADRDRKAGK